MVESSLDHSPYWCKESHLGEKSVPGTFHRPKRILRTILIFPFFKLEITRPLSDEEILKISSTVLTVARIADAHEYNGVVYLGPSLNDIELGSVFKVI